jgi:threonine/homoserine/homoserine lactone efflux protein
MDDATFVGFLAIAAVVIVTPGQDTALTIRNTLLGGRRAGIATALGVGVGQGTWTIAAGLGLTALLVASEPAFAAVRLAGAAYLVYLGAHSLWQAIRPHRIEAGFDGAGGPGRVSNGLEPTRAFRQGAISNLGNPKMAVFFTSLLPQFVAPGSDVSTGMIALGLVFVAMTIAWLSGYAALVARAGEVLRRPRVRRAMDAAMGTILVAFGARLAVDGVEA